MKEMKQKDEFSTDSMFIRSKPALLEGLEIDQYLWSVIQSLGSSDVDEITIDASASWKPVSKSSIKVSPFPSRSRSRASDSALHSFRQTEKFSSVYF